MEHIGFVEAEGGPLVLIDSALARSWAGVEGNDYERACEFFDSHASAKGGAISIGSGSALIWEMCGAGRADIYKIEGNGIIIMRAWLAQNAETSVLKTLAEEPTEKLTDLGEIEIDSNGIAILWATESGHSIDDSASQKVRRPQSLNLDNAGLIVPLTSGKYVAKHDSIKRLGCEVQRLHLKLRDAK